MSEEKKQGDRFNTGKLKWSLVDFDSFEDMVRVLEFGAKKYSTIFAPELEKVLEKWNVKFVREIVPLELGDYVTVAMKQNCLILIRNVRRTKVNINLSIEDQIEKSFWNTIEIDKENVVQIQTIKEKKEIGATLESTVFRQMNSIKENKELVNFVKNQKPLCTLTTTMKLEDLEVFFAVSAITGLDSSMMMLNCLEKLFNISLPTENYIKTGNNNWKGGLKVTEVIESMQRHINALMRGENNDPESGLPHIGHIQCNAMFLGYMLKYKKDMDDRFIDSNKEAKMSI